MTEQQIKKAIEKENYHALLNASPTELYQCEKKFPELTDWTFLYWGHLGIGFTMMWLGYSHCSDEELAKEARENPDLDVPDRKFLESIKDSFLRPINESEIPEVFQFV